MTIQKAIHQRRPVSRDLGRHTLKSASHEHRSRNGAPGYQQTCSASKPAAILAALIFFLTPLPIAAAPVVDVLSVSGTWTAAAPPVPSLNGLDTSAIHWGVPQGASQSGYVFDGEAPPPVLGLPLETPFLLGIFTHDNFVIDVGTSITSATLGVTTDLVVAGQPVSLDSMFSVSHDETLNALPCAPGSLSVCDDLVSVTFQDFGSTAFALDGVNYFVDILGFQVGGVMFSSFLTQETLANTADLIGIVTSTPGQVPHPATLILLLGGLAYLAWPKRARRQ